MKFPFLSGSKRSARKHIGWQACQRSRGQQLLATPDGFFCLIQTKDDQTAGLLALEKYPSCQKENIRLVNKGFPCNHNVGSKTLSKQGDGCVYD